MTPQVARSLVLSFLLIAAAGCRTAPDHAPHAGTPDALAPSAAAERPAWLTGALAHIAELREQGETEAARAAIVELEQSEALRSSMDAEPSGTDAGLVALDAEASKLGLPETQRQLRQLILDRRSSRLAPDDPAVLSAKQCLATTKYALGDLEGARELNEDVLEVWIRLLDPEDPDLLKVQLNLAAIKLALGDLLGARELNEDVLEVWIRLLDPEDPDLLAAKLNLAVTKSALGDLHGARELEEEVLAIQVRRLDAEHPNLLSVKKNLAVTKKALGDLHGARELEEEVLAVQARLLDPEHPKLLATKHNLATTIHALGDMYGARQLNEEVLAAWTLLLDVEHPDLLSAMQNLAATKHAMGDLLGAHRLNEEVLAVRTRLLDAEHPDLLDAMQNLAVTKRELGDLQGALELDGEVLAARTRLLDPWHPRLLDAKHNLAVTKEALGDLDGARELKEEVLAVRARVLAPEHPDLIAAKQNLAVTKRALSDLNGARELEEEVLAVRARQLAPGHPDLIAAKLNLATTMKEFGNMRGARELSRSVLACQRSRSEGLRLEAPRVARATAAEELRRLSDVLFLVHAATSTGEEDLSAELFTGLESLRQVSVRSSGLAQSVRRFPELAPLRDRVGRLRAELGALQSAPFEGVSTDEMVSEISSVAISRDAAEHELLLELARRGVSMGLPTHASVAERLEHDAALISFFRYSRCLDKDPATRKAPPAIESLLAFVVTPDAVVREVELGSIAEVEWLIAEWRAALGKPVEGASAARPMVTFEGNHADALGASAVATTSVTTASSDATRGAGSSPATIDPNVERDAGVELRRRVLDPVLATAGIPWDAPSRRVHLILDDILHSIPLDALPTDDGRRVGDALGLRYEVSTQRLIDGPKPVIATATLLALGGVDFDADGIEAPRLPMMVATPPIEGSGDRSTEGGRWKALEATGPEVETMGACYAQALGNSPIVLTGRDASKRALHEYAPQARFLHIATHGWFAPHSAGLMSQRVLLKERGRAVSDFARAEETICGFASETLCGLALAGANHGRDEIGRVPGIITAEELATLDLSNCELAVLSACETNVGLRRAGQGIQSLQSALHAAGARTVVTSLWKVDDAATRKLMETFYSKLWNERLGKADALWQAKLALRAEGHPLMHWAGWVLTGEAE